jgi:hypothetical protein
VAGTGSTATCSQCTLTGCSKCATNTTCQTCTGNWRLDNSTSVCTCTFPFNVATSNSSSCVYNVTRTSLVVYLKAFKNPLAFFNIMK